MTSSFNTLSKPQFLGKPVTLAVSSAVGLEVNSRMLLSSEVGLIVRY